MRSTIPIPPPPRTPIIWTVRLFRALAEADRRLERRARAELQALGVRVTIDRSWRTQKGGAAQ
jgi:hypothetical protein